MSADQPSLKEHIQKLAKELLPEIISIRRHLHQNPELSFLEYETSKYISHKLAEFGVEHQTGIADTGIVAIIEGKEKGKCIALRADMDALPIQEENNVSYKSTINGVMHACGHDVHTACLLGVAKILSDLKDNLNGSVKLIFQPGEEKLPGGASLMIKEGVLENPSPEAVFAQHVFPSLEVGKVGFKSGMYMASTDELHLTVKGKGGHAAMPDSYVSPLLVTSQILLKLQDYFMVEKTNNPGAPTVVAFGKINSVGGATNIIPDEVKVEGTFRTMNEEWRSEAHALMMKIAEETAKASGGEAILTIEKGYPFLVNDETVTASSKKYAEEYLGKENVETLPLRMTAEDFAFFSQAKPGCFYRLGTANKKSKGITSGVHTPTFDIDESALEVGMGLMAYITVQNLK